MAIENQKRLRQNLETLGWSQQRLAEWLTQLGEPVTRKQVEGWLAKPDSTNYRHCPAWPSLLIEMANVAPPRKPWTEADDEFLRANYAGRGGVFCASQLNRTHRAVIVRANHLGLKSARPDRWQEDQHDPMLRELHARGLLHREIARELGVSGPTLTKHAQRLGLTFNGRRRKRAAADHENE